MIERHRVVAQTLLGPWPDRDPETEVTNAGLHVVARAVGLGAAGGAVIGLVCLPLLLMTS